MTRRQERSQSISGHLVFQQSELAPFRGEFAAASLKRHRVVVEVIARQVFRGEFAAASLKPDYLADRKAFEDRFPRRIRRGLIEAPSTASLISSLKNFRGEFAAASLKLGHKRSTMQSRLAFRGEFAAASLKRPLLSSSCC